MKMSSQFSRQNGKPKRFSIDDAFEEETDEAIKVYGATSPTMTNGKLGQGDSINVNIENSRGYKAVTDTSRDSDSLIQDYYDCSTEEHLHRSCFRHPKVRENWRMVLAATTLLFIGAGLLVTGTLTLSEPNSGLQASVFLLAGIYQFAAPLRNLNISISVNLTGSIFVCFLSILGFICFIPGAYHVVYIYLAAKGKRGYHFHNLPLFT